MKKFKTLEDVDGKTITVPLYRSKARITETSKVFVTRNILTCGDFYRVKITWDKNTAEYATEILGTNGVIEVHGLGIGYGGEGPHGFEWLLRTFGFNYDKAVIFGDVEIGSKGHKVFYRNHSI